jgi:topoisomerase-4 subunit A
LRFDIDLGDLLIKARSAAGNRVTKEIVQKITQKEVGGSTLAARKIWFDTVVGRLNDEGRGKFLGSFKGEDRLLTLYKNGEYRLSTFDLSNHFDEDMVHIEKWVQDRPISAVYFDGERELHFVKRFCCEITSDKRVSYISESEGSYLDVVSTAFRPKIKIIYNKLLKETKNLPDNEVEIADFIEVKGMKAQGNQLTKLKIKEVVLAHPIEGDIPWPEDEVLDLDLDSDVDSDDIDAVDGEAPTIEWDLSKPSEISKPSEDDEENQPTLF